MMFKQRLFTVLLGVLFAVALTDQASALYDPGVGRFCSRDPIGYWDSSDLYLFQCNQPFACIDPTGLEIIILPLRPTPILRPLPRRSLPLPDKSPGFPLPPFGGPGITPSPAPKEPCPKGPNPNDYPQDTPFKLPWKNPNTVRRDGKPCPSDCTQKQLNELTDNVDKNCKAGKIPNCDKITIGIFAYSCKDLLDIEELWRKCAEARKDREFHCFRGGDRGHRIQIAQAENEAAVCWWRFRKEGCPLELIPGKQPPIVVGGGGPIAMTPFEEFLSNPTLNVKMLAERR